MIPSRWNGRGARRSSPSPPESTCPTRTTLIVKLVVVVISGVTASLHIRSKGRSRAILGALTGISALAALFLGVLLAG